MTAHPYRHTIPTEILALSHERDQLRKRGQYGRADELKQQIEDAGYAVKDNPRGAHLTILPSVEVDGQLYRTARQLPSFLNEPDRCTFSVNILARNNYDSTLRCIESVLRFAGDTDIEIILVDNASRDGIDVWSETFKLQEPRLHVLYVTRVMGEAEARNIGLKQSCGRYILLLESSIQVVGDIFTPLQKTLADNKVGITGFRGFRTDDLRHFTESQEREVDVVDGVCMAFRRGLLRQAGLFNEYYRFPSYMDADFNFAVKDSGAQIVVTPNLPVTYRPSLDTEAGDAEHVRLTRRNFYRFLEKWRDREDLLVAE